MQKKFFPTRTKKISKISRKKVIIPAIAAVLLLCALMAGMLAAKYLNERSSDGLVIAKNFYFTSNLLDGGIHTLAPGSTSVTFTLGNHEDDLRYSEVDIDYTVTVDNEEAMVTNDTGMLAAGSVRDAEVTISNLQAGTYTVTAVGTGGYKKTLTATIVVPSPEAAVYKYLDTTNSEYVLLTVWTQSYEGIVTITPPAGMIPDNTDPVMETVKTGEVIKDETSFQDQDGGYCSHTYRFFGSGVTAESFIITYGDGSQTAIEKAPN